MNFGNLCREHCLYQKDGYCELERVPSFSSKSPISLSAKGCAYQLPPKAPEEHVKSKNIEFKSFF